MSEFLRLRHLVSRADSIAASSLSISRELGGAGSGRYPKGSTGGGGSRIVPPEELTSGKDEDYGGYGKSDGGEQTRFEYDANGREIMIPLPNADKHTQHIAKFINAIPTADVEAMHKEQQGGGKQPILEKYEKSFWNSLVKAKLTHDETGMDVTQGMSVLDLLPDIDQSKKRPAKIGQFSEAEKRANYIKMHGRPPAGDPSHAHAKRALDVLTGGHPGDADTNLRQFVGNMALDEPERLAKLSDKELKAEYRAWQKEHDA